MIWQPKIKQRVQVRYDKKRAKMFPFHGVRGQIVKVGRGDGPINCLVRFQWKDEDSWSWSERFEVFPRGNLVATAANEWGVFVENVERIEIFRKKGTEAVVKIAFEEGRWHWGYSLHSSTGGCNGGASVESWCLTRDEAFLESLRVLAGDLRGRKKLGEKLSSVVEAMFLEIEKQLAIYEAKHRISKQSPPKQLDLFGAASFGG